MALQGKKGIAKGSKSSAPPQGPQGKWIIIAVLIIAVFAISGYAAIVLLSQDNIGVPTSVLQERVASKFGGEETIFIAVCLDEETSAKNILRDIRAPAVIQSVSELHERVENETEIEKVQSVATAFKDGVPGDLAEVGEVLAASFPPSEVEGFVNDDFSITLIKVSPIAGLSEAKMEEVREIIHDDIASITKPAGVEYIITGADPQTSELIADQFPGSLRKLNIVVELEPRFARSEEIRDVRDPEVLKYVDLLSKRAKLVDGVVDAHSAAEIIKDANDGMIPKTLRSVRSLLEEKDETKRQQIYDYISKDYSMTLVRLKIDDDAEAAEIVEEIKEVINIARPAGTSVDIILFPER
jgi:predicted RND superfamily exporter protein